MKAAFIERHGGPEVLQYGDLPDPVARPGEVVIETVAASINAADWKVRAGEYKQAKFPYVLGRDFSGVIGAVGEGVADLAAATPCSAFATPVRRAPMPRRSRSGPPSSPESLTACHTSRLPRSRSPGSRR